MKNEIIIFENQNVTLEVNIKDDTVWLNQDKWDYYLVKQNQQSTNT